MQEVEIPPRDLLQHYVAVPAEQHGKTLVWWFSTKRKNISFGLYFKQGKPPVAPSNVFISAASSPTDSPHLQEPPHHAHRYSDGQNPPRELPLSSSAGPGNASPGSGSGTSASSRGRPASGTRNLAALVSSTLNTSLPFSSRGGGVSGGCQPQSPSGQSGTGPNRHDGSPGSPTHDPYSQASFWPGNAADAARASPAPLRRRSRPSWSPKDPDMVCIRPIERYDSATSTIKGSHKIVEDDGMFVLIFDNTFSRNTSKRVTFFVAVKDGPPEDEGSPEIAGWLLKKKRKKMQGWAKRWFHLDRGTLRYYKSPGAYCRGSIQIAFSAVSVHPPQRLIHIDSGVTIYHLKCLTQKDYEVWMCMIRNYYASGTMNGDLARSGNRLSSGFKSSSSLDIVLDGFSTGGQSAVGEKEVSDRRKAATVPADYTVAEKEAGHAINSMKELYENVVRAADKLIEPGLESVPVANASARHSSAKGVRSRAATSGSPGEQGRLKLLKRAASSGFKPADWSAASVAKCHSELSSALVGLKQAQNRLASLLRAELNRRRELEAALRAVSETAFAAGAVARSVTGALTSSQALPQGAMPTSSSVPGPYPAPPTLSPASAVFPGDPLLTFSVSGAASVGKPSAGGARQRSASRASSLNNAAGEDEFFDAEEIVLEEDSSDEESTTVGDNLEDDEDDEADEDEEFPSDSVRSKGRYSAMNRIPTDSAAASATPKTTVPVSASFAAAPVLRRRLLPAPASAEPVSMVSILRKNVGKDFSTLSMPVTTNEPISLLQKLAENLEYSELLDKACMQTDSATRMLYVAAFVTSGYSSGRGTRKPFNPMLGETYELVREDKGFRFIAEKVNHHPVIAACHAESENWIYWHDSKVKTKFWGKSVELTPFGTVHLVLKSSGDHYTWTNPTTWLRNLIGGNKYLEHVGDARIVNHTTGDVCVLQFKESSFFSSAKNEVAGTVTVGESRKTMGVTGKWSEALYHEIEPSQLLILWQARSPLPDAEHYYDFTAFTIELNEITPDIRGGLSPTDSRLRPDLRLFENGDVVGAEAEKKRIEERQRQTRKAMEESGQTWRPAWFELSEDPIDGGPAWVYKGGYWEARQTQQWPSGVELW